MKLAPQQLQDEYRAKLNNMSVTRTSDDVTVRVYTSGKKAKRAINAMQRNGWAYCKPTLYGDQDLSLPRKRRQKAATKAIARLVAFYRP